MKRLLNLAKWMLSIALLSIPGGCTYSVILNHTEGQASDIVDENQTATPHIAPTINIPVHP